VVWDKRRAYECTSGSGSCSADLGGGFEEGVAEVEFGEGGGCQGGGGAAGCYGGHYEL